MHRSFMSQILGLVACLLLTFAVAGIGAIASIDASIFYAHLAKPSWAPPGGVFGPVWSVLYFLMGVAAWLVWRTVGLQRIPTILFFLQLAANALWSWLFFAWHLGGLAMADVLLLFALIAATVVAFKHCNKVAMYLLVPYLVWVGFASLLTWAVWQRNPAIL